MTLEHCRLLFRRRPLFLHMTHESHILIAASVTAEPQFIIQELVCEPAICMQTPGCSTGTSFSTVQLADAKLLLRYVTIPQNADL